VVCSHIILPLHLTNKINQIFVGEKRGSPKHKDEGLLCRLKSLVYYLLFMNGVLYKRCGNGKGYLNETQSVSVRPSGLRIRRAEAWTKGTSRSRCSVSQRNTETFFHWLSHRASEYEGLRPRVIWNWCHILREMSNSAWKTLPPGNPP
jgi:hypothetical protein